MSKLTPPILPVFAAVLLILQLINNSNGQNTTAVIKIDASTRTADVSGKFLGERALRRNFYFVSPQNRDERVTDVRLSASDGSAVAVRKLIPGEYLAESDFSAWTYKVNIAPVKSPSAAAHSSWLAAEDGVLMLDDILPQRSDITDVRLDLPDGWSSAPMQATGDENSYRFPNVSNAVIYVAKGFGSSKIDVGGVSLSLATSGKWLFSDAEALEMAKDIYSEYRNLFGDQHGPQAQIAIMHFPTETSVGNWEAETRGSSVTIVSSDMNFRTQSLQRLHEQLRHEMFHLWMPNAVSLTGKYDWFYEGFALYQSLKTAVAMNRIRFDDYLDTLSRAYSIDARQTKRLSLIDASQARFAGNDTQVYARGMIVAFLTDITLLEQSKGKLSISNLLKRIMTKHPRASAPADGNEAVTAIMREVGLSDAFIEQNVKGNAAIEWNNELSAAGFIPPDGKTGLTLAAKLDGRQKALLDKLGYNNWRKLSR